MRTAPGNTILRRAVAAVGATATAVLVVAVVDAVQLAADQQYWSARLYRLILEAIWTRFDGVILPAAAAAVGLVTIWTWVRRGTPTTPAASFPWQRLGWAALGLVLALRAATAFVAWGARVGPNVLLISIDTLRADRLGAYGYSRSTTPEIDTRLAAEGVTFEHCYSQSPKTTPSHMTMLTSLYPCVHGIELWTGTEPGPVLSPAVHTLAEVLKNAGYATGAFTGRGHVHRSRGFGQGFDVYVHNYQYRHRHRYEKFRQLDRALEWMEEHRDRKFFMFFHTYAVHDPYVPPLDAARLFDDGTYQGPLRAVLKNLRSDAGQWEDAHRVFWDSVRPDDADGARFVSGLYDGAIRHMDRVVMKPLLDQLEALGLEDDTLVVLTSDHGEAFGEHGRFLHGDLYTETLRVPLVLRFPGRLDRGQQIAERVQVIDVMPTILDLVGISHDVVMQGHSLAPAIRGEMGARLAASEFSSPAHDRVFECVRQGDLSYIVDRSTEELFDLGSDPGERTSVMAERPGDTAAMRAALSRWRQDCRELRAQLGPQGEGVLPGEDTIRQLRALGYVE